MLVALTYMQEFGQAMLHELDKLIPGHANLRESIYESLDYNPRFYIHLFGQSFGISDTVISVWTSMVLLTIIAYFMGRRFVLKPGKRQTMTEMYIGFFINSGIGAGMNEEQARSVMPYAATLGTFIMFSNITSVVKIKPPSQDPSFPIILALFTLGYVIYKGISFVGVKGFFNSLIQPMAVLLPFKILDYLIKPVSLAFRLFGNIFGAYILMEFITLVVPIAIPGLFSLWFDFADGIIQGLIFSYLTITYVGEIVEGAKIAEELKEEKKQKRSAAVSA